MRHSKRILRTCLLEDDRVGSRERSGLGLSLGRMPCDWEWVCLYRNESEACKCDRGGQIRARKRCLSEELEFVCVDRARDDQGDDSDAKPERVRREQPGRVPGVDGLRERDPEAQHEETAEDAPLVCRGGRPSLNWPEIREQRDRNEEEKGNGSSSR